MTEPRAHAWLAQFQAAFSQALRTPLAEISGTLRPDTQRYEAALCNEIMPQPHSDPRQQLAAYNGQYWYRLFGVMQLEFPLVARLLGLWEFNHCVTHFLLHHPPRHTDLQRITPPFCTFLEQHRDARSCALPRAALLQAAKLDAVFQRLWQAPHLPPFRPSPTEAQALPQLKLKPAPTFALIDEHWPLLELRTALLHDPGEHAVPLPKALPEAQYWALFRTDDTLHQQRLLPRHALLLRLVQNYSLAAALAELECACPDVSPAELAQATQRWLAQSVELGFWQGVEAP